MLSRPRSPAAHLLRWLARRGRYDYVQGAVTEERRRRDAPEHVASLDRPEAAVARARRLSRVHVELEDVG